MGPAQHHGRRGGASTIAAPAGLPARDLAVALTSMNERVLCATLSGDGPSVAESDVVDVLLELRAIYGSTSVGEAFRRDVTPSGGGPRR